MTALHQTALSLDHDTLQQLWTETENLLIIQDLDGVCMGLVKNPLTREIDLNYVKATRSFDGHFYVLTNGEHIGTRGVNRIIEKNADPQTLQQQGLYLPGLAAGGVQWQDRQGNVSHPGVTDAEMQFLEAVPQQIEQCLQQFFTQQSEVLDPSVLQTCIDASVLDNKVSPTANLNIFYEHLSHRPQVYMDLQQAMHQLMQQLLTDAAQQGLADSFFVHYAPNLGRDDQGLEILRPATPTDSGTTDFQFMLRGAIKEAGVLAILNRYYGQRTGTYPLGEQFSVRETPKDHEALLEMVKKNFDPAEMPLMVGVGDTVNSTVIDNNGQFDVRRGGSDRNFLQLIQDIGNTFNTGNLVVYIDSSGGEVKNRKPIKLVEQNGTTQAVEGPGDSRDTDDPLTLNVVFPQGHRQYIEVFCKAAANR
ncbi:glucosylglycerol 3-phosphatase [Spirulina sp. CS-785/01]|uniref:glucosylglycerol 3-phosphatase n=1 Tax=Spirulina sp. CS-785/01 TaxID=3021716 RepID=UPI00232BE8B6|nr:glucosylglycerol 3-phosphatase [Spirulina sp. CS-785/01]MDB9313345.1 glucosylglycerol 3-phosphatase [Spirulina sp. CS-785/01]